MIPCLRRAVVLGAGTMGAQVAAHLANAGTEVTLLDLDAETAGRGLERARKARPAAFTTPGRSRLVEVAGFDAGLPAVGDADWVIEAVIEQLEPKRDLLARVEQHWQPGTIVSTNTSGISIARIVEGRSPEFARHFLGTHFFNPPRYLHLLELIPTPRTDPGIYQRVVDLAERRLGKGVVRAKDTPAFIANRIGTHALGVAVRLMLEHGLGVDEIDELTGPLIGRPRSATFRTLDLVGLDVMVHVAGHAHASLPDDPDREAFDLPAPVGQMIERGLLGEKTRKGFYRKEGDEILALDLETFEYRPRRRLRSAAVEMARGLDDPKRRLDALLAADDAAGRFLKGLTLRSLAYAAGRIPEIADDIVDVDRALRWGFGWDRGPFETWDLLGAGRVAEWLEAGGLAVPPLAREAVAAGGFYRQDGATSFHLCPGKGHTPVPPREGVSTFAELRAAGRTLAGNAGASLVDLGEGIAGVEFHAKLNVLGHDIMTMIHRGVERAARDFDGLVISTDAADFSAGANLMLLLIEADEGNWPDLDQMVRQFQQVITALRRSPVPVVVAPRGRTLAGGCEICLAGTVVQAAAETYLGLVEVGVGLIPAGGGTTELARRVAARIPAGVPADPLPIFRWGFETIAMAKVATSAEEAREIGLLRDSDRITMNSDRLLLDARATARYLADQGYAPPPDAPVKVIGRKGKAAAEAILHNLRVGNHISDHDLHVARRLAHVMCGGDVPEGTEVSAAYLLDLEREAFLHLLGQPKSQERMRHVLKTGKPLRN
jgi:3-hydroxyacyl-CoA dehydrogenase